MALILHLPMDDNAASTTVVAAVGTNGVLEGGDNTSAKTTAGPGGIIAAGFDLNAVDDAINISANSLSFGSGSAWSMSGWCKSDGVVSRFVGIAGGLTDRILKVNDTLIRINNNSGSNFDYTVASIGTTDWWHLLVTKTAGDSMRVFKNGVESSTSAQSFTGSFSPTYIGRQTTNFHDGKLSYFKFFNSDESANAATLYAEGVTVAGGHPAVKRFGGVKFASHGGYRDGSGIMRWHHDRELWLPDRRIVQPEMRLAS